MECGRLVFGFDGNAGPPHCQMLFLNGDGDSIFGGGRSVLPGKGEASGRGAKRPFFTTASDEQHLLLDDDYYDELLPQEKKRRLTPEQVLMLEKSFEEDNKLEPERKSELANKVGLQPRQVAVWFQNRRARWKTKQLERDYDRLKFSYDALLADHDALQSDNDSLRAQIIALSEQLREKDQTSAGPAEQGSISMKLNLDDHVVAALNADRTVAAAETRAIEPLQPKAEDRLSTGSGGSAVVDGECAGQPVMDSSTVESYFNGDYGCIASPIDGGRLRSELEDDGGSDEGCSFYVQTSLFAAEHHHQHPPADEDDAPLVNWDWNVWS